MRAVKVGELLIGDGEPKVCVSLMATTSQEVLEKAQKLAQSQVDIVEWRLDYVESTNDIDELVSLAAQIGQCVQPKPLLVTFRTLAEGGQRRLSLNDYLALYERLVTVEKVALIDLEFLLGAEALKPLIKKSHAKGVKVIVSNHDFEQTPNKAEIINRLLAMEALGADISKLAAMPKRAADVLELMMVTAELTSRSISKPIVTMSMGELGKISRVAGKLTGSAITFGAVGEVSAPGQLALMELRKIISQV